MEKKNDLRDGFIQMPSGQVVKVIKYACNTYYIALKAKGMWYDFTQYEKDDFELSKQPEFNIQPIIDGGIYIYKQVGEYELYFIAEPMFIAMKKPYKKFIQTLLKEFPLHQTFISKKECNAIFKLIKDEKIVPNKSI